MVSSPNFTATNIARFQRMASADDSASGSRPAWGALPVEQYLIQRWDAESPLSPDEQRTQLVRAFIQEDTIGPDLDPGQTGGAMARTPTADEIATILEPWRPQKLRAIAARHWGHPMSGSSFYFLRTYYGGGDADDATLREWLDAEWPAFEMNPDDEWWQVVSDPDIFDVDDDEVWDDWRQAYDVLPELAAPLPNRGFTTEDVEYVLETVQYRAPQDGAIEDDYEEAIMATAARGSWLLVLDRLAFETGELRLIFLDLKGNVVKEGSLDAEELGDMTIYSFRGADSESPWWLGAGVGKRYGPKGRIMKELMRRVKSAEASRS